MIVIALLFALTPPAQRHYVRVDANGWAVAVPSPPEKLADLERLWTWSPDCPPVLQRGSATPPCIATTAVHVRAIDGEGRAISLAQVVWGTRDLIDQVPDDLLPRAVADDHGNAEIRVAAGEPLFARIVGPAASSDWRRVDVRAQRVELRGAAATDVEIDAVDEQQQAASHVRALISPVSVGGADGLPIFVAGEKGIIRIRRPSQGISRAILWSDESLPVERIEANSRMGGTIVLPRGCAVRGALIADDGKPLDSVAAVVAFPLGTSSRGTRRRTASHEDGQFEVRGLPCGASVLTLTKTGLAPLRRKLSITANTLDLGRVILRPGTSVRFLIVDAKSAGPISGARVALAGEPVVATSGRDGIARLDGIARDEDADLEATAAGYLPATAHAQAASQQPVVIRMTPGATIVARVISGKDQRPAGPGTLWVDLAGTKRIEHFGADGLVRIAGLSAGKLNLEVRVPGFASRKLPQRELETGETVNFGTVALDTGDTIRGSVVDATTSAPLQAHIRVPRPNSSGALLSVVMKDWIEAVTDEAGQFQVSGLSAGDYRLLVESPGFAPALTERVAVGAEQKDNDAGMIRLSPGRRLLIVCRPARRCGSKAELLLGDPNDDWATLTTAISDGRGEILAAPPGNHTLRLLDRGAVVVEKEIDILEDALETTAEIVLRQTRVTGQVSRGGRPVEDGSVQFVGQATGPSLPIFMARNLDAEKVDSDIIGVVPRSVVVSVDDHGSFATDDLGAGTYSVSYSGANGASPKQTVTIPDASTYAMNLDFPAATVRGHIADEHGKVPEWARVEIKSGTTVVSADMMPDGTYAIDGAPSGMATVHAYDNTAEAERETTIEENGETDVDLTLHPKPQKRITITAIGPGGAPVEGANLFLLCDGTLKTSRADVRGSATFDLGVNTDTCIPAAFSAANGWTFGAPVSISSDSEPAESSLQFRDRAVALVVRTGTAAAFAISASNGFPLERAFPFIGWPAVADPSQPLTLRGFPPGTYLIRANGMSQSVVIDGTSDVVVRF